MPVTSNRVETTPEAVVSASIDGAADLLVVDPRRDVVGVVVSVLDGTDDPPSVRLFARRSTLKAATGGFVTAATVADLSENGSLAVRTLERGPQSTLLVSATSVVALIDGPGGAAGLSSTDDAFVAATYDGFGERWERAPTFPVRTPPLSRIRASLREELGAAVAADFDRTVAVIEADSAGQVDETVISLLAAARNEALLYDVSAWGEGVGLASRATFSRAKTRLEEAGLLATEKVPIEVGRPRLRLRLPDRLAGVSIDQLVEEARAQL